MISNTDRSAFAEAHNTILDNFTDEEQAEVHEIASRLRKVLEAAKRRSGAEEAGSFGKGFQVALKKEKARMLVRASFAVFVR
jgi:hypothetical protein